MKLIALPFAGGMGNEFKSWKALIGDRLELITVQYPGRGQRSEEPCATTFNVLLEDIYKQVILNIKDGQEYMLFGHSMGCIFTYELYFKLKENGYKLPCHVFFSGNRTPKECLKDSKMSELEEAKFRDYFVQLGGISTSVLEDEKMSYHLFKRLRKDVRALESYIYTSKDMMIDCEVSILNGTQDYFVSDVSSWEALLGKKCHYKHYEGGHFFVFNQKVSVTAYIMAVAEQLEICSVV